jgi:hypothetical protein
VSALKMGMRYFGKRSKELGKIMLNQGGEREKYTHF